jgi:hypothetical protein
LRMLNGEEILLTHEESKQFLNHVHPHRDQNKAS